MEGTVEVQVKLEKGRMSVWEQSGEHRGRKTERNIDKA